MLEKETVIGRGTFCVYHRVHESRYWRYPFTEPQLWIIGTLCEMYENPFGIELSVL